MAHVVQVRRIRLATLVLRRILSSDSQPPCRIPFMHDRVRRSIEAPTVLLDGKSDFHNL
jgi:hypothetical protein